MILIVGGESLIGRSLARYWSENNIPFHSSTRHNELKSEKRPFIDLLETQSFENLSAYKVAVLCAAITDIATCENAPEESRIVNVSGTIELIKKLLRTKTHIVYLSTNQVFNGEMPHEKPDATRNPINEYGRQKAEVEAFLETIPGACILRLTKVIHPSFTILRKWKHALSSGEPIFAFSDMALSPIDVDGAVQKIDFLVNQKNFRYISTVRGTVYKLF